MQTTESVEPVEMSAEAPIEAPVDEEEDFYRRVMQDEPASEGEAAEAAPEVEQDDEPVGAEPETPQAFTVRVDGKEVSVTLEDLTRSYSGQAYIQKGMQEVATQRRQAEQEIAAARQQVVEMVQTLQTQGLRPAPRLPDPKLAETNMQAYIQARAKYDVDLQSYQAQQVQIGRMQQAQTAANEAAEQAYVSEQVEALKASIPDFGDAEKGSVLRSKLIAAGTEHYGFTDAEIMGVMDARAIRVLHDAARYRELVAQKATAKAAPPVPKTVKPGARTAEPPQLAFAKLRDKARKSQSIDDFARALMQTPE